MAEIAPSPVVRAAYVVLFMDLASRRAADRAAGLARVGLPPIALDQPDAYVPLRAALRRNSLSSRKRAITDGSAAATLTACTAPNVSPR